MINLRTKLQNVNQTFSSIVDVTYTIQLMFFFIYFFLFLFFIFYFFLFYNHTWHSLTIQLHGTYLQQDYKIYLRYSFTTYLFATYLH